MLSPVSERSTRCDFLWFVWTLSSVNQSESNITRSRRCLPFLLSVFVTNFNNFWHSINFSLLKDISINLHFYPSSVQKCHESCRGRIDRRLAGNEVDKWLSCSIFPFFCPNWEKQINKVGRWFSFTLFSLLSFRWPLCSHALPLWDTLNNLLNGMQNLTFVAFSSPFWLVTH